MTVVQGITPDMAPPAAVGLAGVTAPVPGMIIVRITVRVCAWVVDRTVSSTGISIVTGRADRVTAAVARAMRQWPRLVNQVTRVNIRATRVVVQVTAAAVRVMRQEPRLVNQVTRVKTRATRVVVRVTAAAARVMRRGPRLVNQVTRVNTRATRVAVQDTAAVASRVVLLTIARAAASELRPRPGIIQTMLE
jgi:hypothetical protein